MGTHDHVLKEIAETGFDRPFVAAVDLEIVGHRPHLADVAIGLGEDQAGTVAVLGAGGVELLEGAQPRGNAGDLLLRRAEIPGAALPRGSRRRQLGLAGRPLDAQEVHRLARARHASLGGCPLLRCPLGFNPQVMGFDVELGDLLANAATGAGGVLHRVAQGRRCVHRGEDLAARRLDVTFEALDADLQVGVGVLLGGEIGSGLIPFGDRLGFGGAAVLELDPCRFAPALERGDLRFDAGGAGSQRLDLVAIEGDLLLQTSDGQLTRVRELARFRFGRVGLRELETERFGGSFDLGQAGGGERFPIARIGQLRPRRVDGRAERSIPQRELHFLPSPQLFTQAAVAPRLGRLALQRAALLFDLEHDVVDAGQVLLRRFELELGGAAAALVFRDAGGFLDQLPSIGGPGAQNLANLALLDDRITLDANAGVHQQVLHVLQAAGLSVDQVLALARSVEPAHQLDVANDERRIVLQQPDGGPGKHALRRDLRVRDRRHLDGVPGPVTVAVAVRTVAVAVAIAMTVAIGFVTAVATRGMPWHSRGDAAQLESDFRGTGGPARIAAAENEVLHPVAAQALGALLAKHPGERIDDVALAAAVRPNDGSDSGVEGELRPIRKALEAGNLQALQSHG